MNHLLGDLQIFETIFWSKASGYFLFPEHLRRLESGAQFFRFPFDLEKIRIELEKNTSTFFAENQRVRLLLEKDGRFSIVASPCLPPAFITLPPAIDAHKRPAEQRIRFAELPVCEGGAYRYYKTTCRPEYDAEYIKVAERGELDAVFCNARGELTEGCISNIIILKDGVYSTPPVSCGILPGVMRAYLLAKPCCSAPLCERVLTRDDVEKADAVFICNSVRGVVRVKLVY